MRRLRCLLVAAGLIGGLFPGSAMATGVNTATGAFTTQATDLSLPGLGVALEFTRTYNSNADLTSASADAPLGPRWRHSYETSVSVNTAGDVLVTATDGQQATFLKDGSDYVRPAGIRADLSLASGTYTLETPDGRKTLYDASTGHVTSMVDRLDHGLTFGYASGILTTVTDEAGREVDLTYDDVDGHERLVSVELEDGRHVDYAYGSDYSASLSEVTDVLGGDTAYGYTDNPSAYLETITDANESAVLTNTYDDAGRVISQADALDQDTTYEWDDSGPTTVVTTTLPNGATHVDEYDGFLLVATVDPLSHETRFGYNEALNRTSVTDGRGVETEMTYDAAGNLTATSVPSLGYSETRTYDSDNNLLTATDARGKTTTNTWSSGLLTSKELADGGQIDFTYNGDGQVATVTDARGKTTTYAYDADGNRTSATTPLGRETTWDYDASGRVTATTDPRGKETTFTHDAADRRTSVTDPRANQTTYAYDPVGNLTSVTDADTGVTSYAYDDLYRRTGVTDAESHTTTTGYDEVGNVTSSTSATGDEETFAYDLAGRMTSRVSARGNESGATAADFTWHYTYDANGNQTVIEDPLGHETTTTYDDLNRPTVVEDALSKTTTTAYDQTGNPVSVTDPNGHETTTTYDEMGRPLVTTSPEGRTTTRAYDDAGNLVSVTDGAGGITTFAYDDDGLLASSVDPRGNESGATPADYRTDYTFDDAAQLTETEDPLGHTTSTSYDDAGNVAATTDANAHTTTYAYDDLNRIASVTAPGSATTTYDYDGVGNVLSRTDANSHTTTYAYDAANRPTGTTLPTGEETTVSYDAEGDPVTLVTGRGNASMTPATGTISSSYDALGRLTDIDYGDTTPDVAFDYDALGRLTQMDDGPGTETYSYDDAGRLTGITRGSDSFAYAYDDDGNLTSRTRPGASVVSSTFDDAGRLASITTGGATTTYSYDAAGQLTTTTLPSGTGYAAERTYDAAGRLTSLENAAGSSVLSRFERTLDAVGNPTRLDTTRGATTTSEAYQYDSRDRLTQYCRAASCTGATSTIAYSYDPVGNRTQQVRTGVSAPGTTSYAYDASNRMTSSTIGAATTTYGYDADGNRTSAGTTTMAYDLADRMTAFDDGTTATSYLYDGLGKRLRATIGSAQTRFVWDPSYANPELVLERDASSALIRSHTPGLDGSPLSMSDGSNTFYLLQDDLGSTADVISASGVAQSRYSYEPFGDTTETSLVGGAPANPVRFAGEYQDPTALYHLRARQYDPASGSFTARDAVDDGLGEPATSAYAYVDNRPGVLIDPSGMIGCGFASGACDLVQSGAGRIVDAHRVILAPAIWQARFGAGLAYGTGELAFNAGAGALRAGHYAVTHSPSDTYDRVRSACDNVYARGGGWAECIAQQSGATELKDSAVRVFRQVVNGCDPFQIGRDSAGLAVTAAAAVVPTVRLATAARAGTAGATGAESSLQGALLREHLRLSESYGAAGVRQLESGRIRYYGELRAARTPGAMAGQRTVREWDPATGQQRTWLETIDREGQVRIVRPETAGPKTHYYFGTSGASDG